MRLLPTVLVPLLVAGCGSPPSPPAPASAPIDAGTSAVTADTTDAEAAPRTPAPLTDVTALAKPTGGCTIAHDGWRGDELPLAVSPAGATFATLGRAHRAELTLAPPSIAFLHARTGSAEVDGFVNLDRVRVTTKKAVVFGGLFVPGGASLGLGVSKVADDRVTLTAPAPSGVELVAPTALTAEVGCGDVALAPSAFDPGEAIATPKKPRDMLFVPKRTVMLSIGPTDAPAARITVDDSLASQPVTLLEERGRRARVRWSTADGVLFGWVASSDLKPWTKDARALALANAIGSAQFGMIGFVNTPSSGPPKEVARLACKDGPRMIAEIEGRRYAVGRIVAKAPFALSGRGDAVAPLVGPGSLRPHSNGQLVVAASEIAQCEPSKAAELADPADAPDAAALSRDGFGAGAVCNDPNGAMGVGCVGKTGGKSALKTPTLRQGTVTVNGRLPPEIIQRIVHQSFGRFRACYEAALKRQPGLHGRVATKFVVEKDGSVKKAPTADSDMSDKALSACITKGFESLSFPQPEGGIVTVVYPIVFSID